MALQMTGAEMVIRALADQGVEHLFGYPGGAVLPIYDELFQQEKVRHVLVRQEGGAVHAAEGYARSTGKVGVVLVTSGPGATNAVTGLTDALMDSIPVVCITGQVPTHLIGNDAFQECDTVGITRPCTKHNWLVKNVERSVARAARGVLRRPHRPPRPGRGRHSQGRAVRHRHLHRPQGRRATRPISRASRATRGAIAHAVELMSHARRPVLYTGGGVINSGRKASQLLRELVRLTGFPITSTLMGLGAFPASGKEWLGMLGMHGTYEANLAMHDCDVMVCIGARFDDRITGRIDQFSPRSKKIHIDIDPSSINKNVKVDVPIIGDVAYVLEELIRTWKAKAATVDKTALKSWWAQIDKWRARKCLAYKKSSDVIMPQYAIERLYALTQDRDVYITTEVGQHQMWAAQFFHFEEPNRWMTSGGLGTMGYGLPAAIGAQMAHPKSLVIDIAGDASILMNIQEMSTAVQYRLPVKVFILNNQYMGMVRQWQQLLHGNRISDSYTAALPDFVKLAEAYGGIGIRCDKPAELDDAILAMLNAPADKPVLFDCRVAALANCFPMIPSGKAHNEMLLGEEVSDEEIGKAIGKEGKVLV